MGHERIVAPLLTVRRLPMAADALADAGTLAFTSANGVDAIGGSTIDHARPVFAVGDATAEAAAAAGFTDVRSAAGDVTALAALISATRPPEPIVHVCAVEPAGDLVGLLTAGGLRARRLPAYAAHEESPSIVSTGTADAILIHSPRAARRLAVLRPAAHTLVACISAAAGEPLLRAGWTAVRVAGRPDETALLALLERAGIR